MLRLMLLSYEYELCNLQPEELSSAKNFLNL